MQRTKAAGLGGKDMWKKYPRQMLRARVISEGVRAICPGVTAGFYTPEEVADFPQTRGEVSIEALPSGIEEEGERYIEIEAEPPAPIPSPPLPKADYNDMYLPDDTVAQMLYWRARAQGVPLDKAYGPLVLAMKQHVDKLIDKGLISVPKKAAHYRLYPALQARVMIQANQDVAQGESADYSLDDAKIYIEGEAK